mmetsp:Transcript_18702/g.22327  ORF Transcript_18702/g.22327 Transcript_18702/m.22327 type:complete len:118 (+) Transcript_18702:430-783(+)
MPLSRWDRATKLVSAENVAGTHQKSRAGWKTTKWRRRASCIPLAVTIDGHSRMTSSKRLLARSTPLIAPAMKVASTSVNTRGLHSITSASAQKIRKLRKTTESSGPWKRFRKLWDTM